LVFDETPVNPFVWCAFGAHETPRSPKALNPLLAGVFQSSGSGAVAWAIEFCGFLKPPAGWQEATARCANRRLPVSFKALIRRGSPIGGHARQQMIPLASDLLPFPGQMRREDHVKSAQSARPNFLHLVALRIVGTVS
jgi:hypothetical protein